MVGYPKIRTGLKYPRNGWSANWTRISKTQIFRVYPPSLNQSTPWSPPPVYNNNSRSQNVNKQLTASRKNPLYISYLNSNLSGRLFWKRTWPIEPGDYSCRSGSPCPTKQGNHGSLFMWLFGSGNFSLVWTDWKIYNKEITTIILWLGILQNIWVGIKCSKNISKYIYFCVIPKICILGSKSGEKNS